MSSSNLSARPFTLYSLIGLLVDSVNMFGVSSSVVVGRLHPETLVEQAAHTISMKGAGL